MAFADVFIGVGDRTCDIVVKHKCSFRREISVI